MNSEECANVQPAVNWKCIYFTLFISTGYWYLPPRNKWVLLALLYFPYILLAYYDHGYQCRRNMGPTYLALFYHWAKPQDSKQIQLYKNWCPQIKNKVFAIDLIILIILLFLFPYFLQWNPK